MWVGISQYDMRGFRSGRRDVVSNRSRWWLSVPEGWGLTWAADQIWSGMYEISLFSLFSLFQVGRMAFRFRREGRRCTVRMRVWMQLRQGLYVAADQDRINCHSHLTTFALLGHWQTVSLWGGGYGGKNIIQRHNPLHASCPLR